MLVDKELQNARRKTMPFGKYSGQPLGWIEENDLLYLDWLIGQEIRAEWLRTALTAICKENASEIERLMENKER